MSLDSRTLARCVNWVRLPRKGGGENGLLAPIRNRRSGGFHHESDDGVLVRRIQRVGFVLVPPCSLVWGRGVSFSKHNRKDGEYMRVTIISRSENLHADVVAEYCRQRAEVSRINLDFDVLGPDGFPSVVLGKCVNQEPPDSVFVHQSRIGYLKEWFVDEVERRLFVASWDSFKEWMEAQYPNARWVNRPSANQRGRNVLGQVQLANRLGFNVPSTLFTNDAEELKRFAGASTVVIKQGNLGVHIEKKRILTSVVDVASINSNMLRGCPCLFQKYVPKKFELRVHVIGDTVLTCKIDSQANSKTSVDWRNYDIENTPHEAYELDGAISAMCVDVVRELGLEFGVIDMIVTPEDQHVFLECNSQGHWIWIEQLTGLPITKTLCEHLLRGSM